MAAASRRSDFTAPRRQLVTLNDAGWGPEGVWGDLSFVFPCNALECSAIHLAASCSVIKPLITSVSPSGHRISTPQPDPGFFRATKVGRCSDVPKITACNVDVKRLLHGNDRFSSSEVDPAKYQRSL